MNELMNVPVNPIQTQLDQMVIIQNGRPYWSARQILDLVGYNVSKNWSRICDDGPIAKTINDCKLSGYMVPSVLRVPLTVHNGTNRDGSIRYRTIEVDDYFFDKHQCNLMLINCDGRWGKRDVVAAVHAYFSESAMELEALAAQNPQLQFRSPECYQQRDNIRSLDRLVSQDITNCNNYNRNSFGILKSEGDRAFLGSTTAEFKEQHGIPANSPLNNHVDMSLIMSRIQAFIMTHTYAVMNGVEDVNDLIQNHITTNSKMRQLFKEQIGFWPEELPVMIDMEKEKKLREDFRFLLD